MVADEGRHHDQFIVDVVQGGPGTSTNMNANEGIAYIAFEAMGLPKGKYVILNTDKWPPSFIDHPDQILELANPGQSSQAEYRDP